MDSSDTRYLKQSYAPIIDPLKKPLNIELYNDKWFGAPPKTISLPLKHDHAMLYFPSTVPTQFPNLSDLHEETDTSPPEPFIENLDIDDCSLPTPTVLYYSLLTSDGLFLLGIHLKVHLCLVGFWFK